MGVIQQRENPRRENLLDALTARLNVDGSSDSVVAVLAEVIGDEIEKIENEIYDYFYRNNINNSEGEDLDQVAASDWNVNRLAATAASSNKFYFYVIEGTFGDINRGNNITIPSGTLLGIVNEVSSGSIVYRTTEDIVLPADNNSTAFFAEATSVGADQNVAEQSISYHNFTNYTAEAENLLLVTNLEAITNGAEEENDSSLRTRCVGQQQLQVERNKNYIYLSLLKETSIYNFEIIESYFGIGTVGIIVKGQGNGPVSPEVISSLQTILQDEAQFLGQRIEVVNGLKLRFQINISCEARDGNLNAEGKASLFERIKRRLFEEIKNQEVNNLINFATIENTLKSEFDIMNVGSNNSIFQQIHLFVEDGDHGAPEQITVRPNSNVIVERYQYVGTDMDIDGEVR